MEGIENLNDKYVELMKNMGEKIIKKEKLKEELKKAKKELDDLGITKENYKEKNPDEQKEWRQKNGEVQKIKNQLEGLKDEIDKIGEDTRALKNQLIEMYPEIKKIVEELTQKAVERNKKNKISDIENKKNKLETKKEKLEAFKELYQKNLGVKACVRDLVKDIETLPFPLNELKSKIEQCEAKREEIKNSESYRE